MVLTKCASNNDNIRSNEYAERKAEKFSQVHSNSVFPSFSNPISVIIDIAIFIFNFIHDKLNTPSKMKTNVSKTAPKIESKIEPKIESTTEVPKKVEDVVVISTNNEIKNYEDYVQLVHKPEADKLFTLEQTLAEVQNIDPRMRLLYKEKEVTIGDKYSEINKDLESTFKEDDRIIILKSISQCFGAAVFETYADHDGEDIASLSDDLELNLLQDENKTLFTGKAKIVYAKIGVNEQTNMPERQWSDKPSKMITYEVDFRKKTCNVTVSEENNPKAGENAGNCF